MLVYEWVHGIEYTNRILHFLYEIDAIMVPKLSERVEMASYAGKPCIKRRKRCLSARMETI